MLTWYDEKAATEIVFPTHGTYNKVPTFSSWICQLKALQIFIMLIEKNTINEWADLSEGMVTSENV